MIGAIMVAFFLYLRPKLWGSRLIRGDYGIAVTHWLFGVLGTIFIVGSAYLYINYKVNAMESMGAASNLDAVLAIMGAFSAPATAAVVVLLHQVLVIVAVWRATAKNGVSFWRRWFTRYALCLNAFIVALVFSFCLVSLSLGFGGYFIARRLILKRKIPASGSVKSSRLKGEMKNLVAADKAGHEDMGSVEIVLANISPDEPMLEEYLQCLKVSGKLVERVHIAPNIPVDKLKRAINGRHFKSGLVEQKALLLIDDSDNFTGLEGLLVTDQLFDFRSPSGEGHAYGYRLGFDGFDVEGDSIFRMNEKCVAFRNINADVVSRIFLLLNSYFSDHRAWCEKKAHDGDSIAQFKMSMYAKNKAESLVWLRKAAEQGHVIAQSNLGAELAGSNLEHSYYWLSRAAEQGNEISMQRLSSAQYDVFR